MRNDKIKINITYNLALKHKGTLKNNLQYRVAHK